MVEYNKQFFTSCKNKTEELIQRYDGIWVKDLTDREVCRWIFFYKDSRQNLEYICAALVINAVKIIFSKKLLQLSSWILRMLSV